MRRAFDDSMAIDRSSPHLIATKTASGTQWWYGWVTTRHGIVGVYRDQATTRIDFAYRGRLYIRTWRDQWVTDRAIAIRAGKFAREIASRRVTP